MLHAYSNKLTICWLSKRNVAHVIPQGVQMVPKLIRGPETAVYKSRTNLAMIVVKYKK